MDRTGGDDVVTDRKCHAATYDSSAACTYSTLTMVMLCMNAGSMVSLYIL